MSPSIYLCQYISSYNAGSVFFRFLSLNGVGFRVKKHLKDFVDCMYRIVRMKADPPEEFAGFLSDEGSFALVEITINLQSEE